MKTCKKNNSEKKNLSEKEKQIIALRNKKGRKMVFENMLRRKDFKKSFLLYNADEQ